MSYSPPPSPPLPTFAIKDLSGPANPPGFISISRRRYDATIKSSPYAALLYLDDDDGELITVGSGLELKQRLDEPVPKYIHEFRNPSDGKLVHVFDIKHTPGGLFEWRNHEVRPDDSTLYGPRQDGPASMRSNTFSITPSPPIVYPRLPKPSEKEDENLSVNDTGELNTPVMKQEDEESDPLKIDESFNVLGGIEEHLSGLANVLQIAANTLQKAADKTRETDTSVVEDILLGVKGILTQVGTFGVEAFRELGTETNTTLDQSSNPEASSIPSAPQIAARLAKEAKEEVDARNIRDKTRSSDADIPRTESQSTKVAFDLPIRAAREAPAPSRYRPLSAQIQNLDSSEATSKKSQSLSFLDDSSEDADFTARFPPLSTIRRARSTIERPTTWSLDRQAESAAPKEASHVISTSASERMQSRITSVQNPFASPFASPKPSIVEPTEKKAIDNEDRKDASDSVRKPLPGAWPDVKSDSTIDLPVPTESSGDFFNRMVGRGRPARYRPAMLESGLSRSNTTATSNPASRLNGPFDPGFPYDPSPSAGHRPGPLRPFRHHRRSVSPPRHWSRRHQAESSVENDHSAPKMAPRLPPTVPAKTRSFLDNHDNRIVSPNSKFDSHRAVRHHRSVPRFLSRPPPPPPPQLDGAPLRPMVNGVRGPPPRANTDFFSGPPMAMPPAMPFTTRPTFHPRPVPPNFWAPWQSSPPAQTSSNTMTSNEPAVASQSSRNLMDSPISAEATLNKDYEIPSNSPPWTSAQLHQQSRPSSPPSIFRYSTPPALPTYFPPPPAPPAPRECMQIKPATDKIDECVQQLKMCGFGVDDDNLKNRLHVYAVAADGDVMDAVEMIEQDRQMSSSR